MSNIFNFTKILLKKVLPTSFLNIVKKRHYVNTLKNFNLENEPDLALSKNLIMNGDLVVDIGANIGIYSKHMSEFVGLKGKVFSFEPILTTYTFLKNNISLLGLKNIESYNFAISDNSDVKTMVIPSVIAGENYFRATIVEKENKSDNSTSYEVQSVPLDKILNPSLKYSFIKIDVEGHEENVLKGSKETIEFSKPILLIEIESDLADSTTSAGRINQYLSNLGYQIYLNNNQKLVKWKEGASSINYFFIHKSSLPQIANELFLDE